jgi:hypothetical protein
MTDRELLEMAAKAAGMTLQLALGGTERDWAFFSGDKEWNPLTDDGDALRLAVKLEIDIGWSRKYVVATAEKHVGGPMSEFFSGNNREPAIRRAIVRAAAEIGRTV